ncbi:MAG: hypothetical protein HKM05_01940 [Spirochaetales bacterium]|nr:hypothetical protein [Spirochaetales bacterium]
MERGQNLLYTASDRKYGDFLIEHWLPSLLDHRPEGLSLRVLDYGLSLAQRFYLEQKGVGVIPCRKDRHVTQARFRDMSADLSRQKAEVAVLCDSGDLIFQSDFSELLKPDLKLRAAAEDAKSGSEFFLSEEFFTRPVLRRIRESTALKPLLNAGVLAGPPVVFHELASWMDNLIINKTKFGPDQVVVNLYAHERGYDPLPAEYNFVLASAERAFTLREGVFYHQDSDQVIPIVHNAGHWKFLRPIENFGYGASRNILKPDVLAALRIYHRSLSFLVQRQEKLNVMVSRLWKQAIAEARSRLGPGRPGGPFKT